MSSNAVPSPVAPAPSRRKHPKSKLVIDREGVRPEVALSVPPADPKGLTVHLSPSVRARVEWLVDILEERARLLRDTLRPEPYTPGSVVHMALFVGLKHLEVEAAREYDAEVLANCNPSTKIPKKKTTTPLRKRFAYV
jgi:hypothetical protein